MEVVEIEHMIEGMGLLQDTEDPREKNVILSLKQGMSSPDLQNPSRQFLAGRLSFFLENMHLLFPSSSVVEASVKLLQDFVDSDHVRLRIVALLCFLFSKGIIMEAEKDAALLNTAIRATQLGRDGGSAVDQQQNNNNNSTVDALQKARAAILRASSTAKKCMRLQFCSQPEATVQGKGRDKKVQVKQMFQSPPPVIPLPPVDHWRLNELHEAGAQAGVVLASGYAIPVRVTEDDKFEMFVPLSWSKYREFPLFPCGEWVVTNRHYQTDLDSPLSDLSPLRSHLQGQHSDRLRSSLILLPSRILSRRQAGVFSARDREGRGATTGDPRRSGACLRVLQGPMLRGGHRGTLRTVNARRSLGDGYFIEIDLKEKKQMPRWMDRNRHHFLQCMCRSTGRVRYCVFMPLACQEGQLASFLDTDSTRGILRGLLMLSWPVRSRWSL